MITSTIGKLTGALLAVGATAAVLVPSSAAAAPSTVQANQDGVCTGGEYCFASNILGNGSLSDFSVADGNLNNNVYTTPGLGQGTPLGNTAKWGWNYDSTRSAVICTGTNYTGSCAGAPPNTGGQYNVTYRGNVESIYWT
ncbi:hypothetical protein OHS59_38205 [Streptomyces sp. NBC_00414]|uniref:hypothetical protein n=1 Tax=Streptomyces sp. NBC_00414 TaxID=2975739 RepID=UPI002E21D646